MIKRKPGKHPLGRHILEKVKAKLKSDKEFAAALENKLAEGGINKEWMKKHLIITKA